MKLAATVNNEVYGSVIDQPGGVTQARPDQEEVVVPIRDILRVIWRRLWVIALSAVVLCAAVVGAELLLTPTYETSIRMLVGQEQTAEQPSSLGSDVQGLQQFTQTVAELANTLTVAEAVVEELDLRESPEEVLGNMSVQQAGATQVVEITYRDTDPERAQLVANTVGEVFSEQVEDVSTSANSITATVWQEARLPDAPASPNPLRDGLAALVLGGLLGLGLAFLLEYLDDRWRSPEEAEQITGVPTFGMIRKFELPRAAKGKASGS